jgi:hypothetical protein
LIKLKFVLLLLVFACANCFAQLEQGPDIRDVNGTVRTVTLWHILFKDRSSAEAVRRRLLAVPPEKLFTNFQIEARKNSLDEDSGRNGGALGDVTEGDFEKDFERQVFSLQPQQLSEAIRSNYGWHLAFVSKRVDRPIAKICDSLLEKALAAVQGKDFAALSENLNTPGDRPLPKNLMSIMGSGWGPPMRDSEGDVNYIRATPTQKPGRMIVTRHKEYSLPRYYRHGGIDSCARSIQIVQEVNCVSRTLGSARVVMYEGRAAQGETVGGFIIPAINGEKPMPNTIGEQMVESGCDSKR